MNRLAYDKMAREVLWLLLQSRRLRPVARDRLVAYEVYFLPPRILFDVPDQDCYVGLLSLATRDEHARMLAAAVLRLVSTEERESWVVWTPAIDVEIGFAEGSKRASARPSYEPREAELRPASPAPRGSDDVLVRLTNGHQTLYLRRGEGLVPVARGPFMPRVTLMEADGSDSDVIAWLLATGPARAETGDGRATEYPPRVRIPVGRDMSIRVRPPGTTKLWRRSVDLEVEVLGLSRMMRPRLLVAHGLAKMVWDRNREPTIALGESEGARVFAPALDIGLRSCSEDRVEVDNRSSEPTWIGWYDGAPLRLPAGATVPVQGAHLRSFGAGEGTVSVRLEGAEATAPPHVIEVHGRLSRRNTGSTAVTGRLFGYEDAVASIYQDGVYLAEGDGVLRIPVRNQELVGPLLRVCFDGCEGAKVMPLSSRLRVLAQDSAEGSWLWVEDVVAIALPEQRLRLEVVGRPRLVYGEPLLVREVSADPDDRWQLAGWRFRVAANGLAVNGSGRVGLSVDRQAVSGPTLLPPVSEHHVEAGSAMYRIVRRGDAARAAGRGA